MKNTDIIFIKVADSKTKLWRLCDCIRHHFLQGERLLVAVSGGEAAKYIDELLWRMPEESFMPHSIIDSPSNERIAITLSQENLNKATVLFNLQTTPYAKFDQFSTLYEFYDESQPAKAELSQQRLQAYPQGRFLNT
jgi:DNA polymerase III subunit chi